MHWALRGPPFCSRASASRLRREHKARGTQHGGQTNAEGSMNVLASEQAQHTAMIATRADGNLD